MIIAVLSMDTFSEHVVPALISVGISTFSKFRLKVRRLLCRKSLDLTLNFVCGSKLHDVGLTSMDKWLDRSLVWRVFQAFLVFVKS